MTELGLKQVTFTFEDGSQRVLVDDELVKWQAICLMHSDYLLPGNPSHVLASMFGGIVEGFVPPEVKTERR